MQYLIVHNAVTILIHHYWLLKQISNLPRSPKLNSIYTTLFFRCSLHNQSSSSSSIIITTPSQILEEYVQYYAAHSVILSSNIREDTLDVHLLLSDVKSGLTFDNDVCRMGKKRIASFITELCIRDPT